MEEGDVVYLASSDIPVTIERTDGYVANIVWFTEDWKLERATVSVKCLRKD